MDKEEKAEEPGSTAIPARVAPKRSLSRFQLKCVNCEFRVSTPRTLEIHARVKHPDDDCYRCKLCNFFAATSEWMHDHLSSDSHQQRQKAEESTGPSSFDVFVERVSRDGASMDDIAQGTGGDGELPLTEGDQEAEEAVEAVEAAKAALAEEEALEPQPAKKKKGRPKQGPTTTCGYCGLVVSNAANLSVHVRRRHSKEYGYNCTLCNYSCVTKGDMDRHCITKKHVRRAQDSGNNNPVNTPNHTSAQTQDANSVLETTDEEQAPDNTTSKENSGEEETQSDVCHKESKYDSVNACNYCDFVAQSIPSLQLHVKRKHTKDFEFVCLACNYYAVTSREMARHASTDKHKQKSQKYLEPVGNDRQRNLQVRLKEVIGFVQADPHSECEPHSPTEVSAFSSDDGQAVSTQHNAAPPVEDAAKTVLMTDGTEADEGKPSCTGSEPEPANQTIIPITVSEPQQTPVELQPVADQSTEQESQEEGVKQADNVTLNADVVMADAIKDSPQSDAQMSKALPFDACIVSMKTLAEQEQVLQEGLALESEAAVICLTGGSSGPPSIPVPSPATPHVKMLKPKQGKDDVKATSARIRCDDCGFMADGISGLNVHISMKHPTKEKHFHCMVCGKSFYTENNLHQHLSCAAHLRNEQNSVEELPEGGASFKCVKCTERFETEQDLFVHFKEKHEELLREVNKYVLEDTEQINREREENQGSVCKYCGKVCKSSNSMAFLAHIRTHTGMYFGSICFDFV